MMPAVTDTWVNTTARESPFEYRKQRAFPTIKPDIVKRPPRHLACRGQRQTRYAIR